MATAGIEGAVHHEGPMVQFEIHKIFSLNLFGYDVSFTNSSLMMIVSLVLICGFMILAMNGRSLVPSRVQSMAEIVYEYVAGMVTENLGQDGMKFFPWVFSIFIFVSSAQFHRLDPGQLHGHEPHHRDIRAGRDGLDRRDAGRLLEARLRLSEAFRA